MPNSGFLFTMLAGVAGAVGGTLLGVAGGLGGDLARKGERRQWIEWSLYAVMFLGDATFIAGVIAWLLGEAFTVWIALLIVGLLLFFLALGVSRLFSTMRSQATKKS